MSLMVHDFRESEKRIKSVFPKNMKDISRRKETIEIYKSYLENNLTFPIALTGIDDFAWEEFYVLGPGDCKEYEELKKKRPSYLDTFHMICIDDNYDDDDGLFAKVTRVADKKRFQLPLADLKVVDGNSTNFQILDDYAIWFVNY